MGKVLLGVTCLFLSLGCQKKKEDEKYGKVSVEMANATSSSLRFTAETSPSKFQVKLKYIVLIEDKEGSPSAANGYNGDNKGNGVKLWASPECSTETKDEETGASYGEILDDKECEKVGIDYFELARESDAVNEDLNSQKAKVLPGTYRYITMGLLGEQQGGNNEYTNTLWEHETSSTGDLEFASVRTEWSAKFSKPLVVEENQTVGVTLTYDLSEAVATGVSDPFIRSSAGDEDAYDSCTEDETVCFAYPTMDVSAEVVK
jgi:hypothetical protein